MRNNEDANGRAKLTGLAVGAAVLLAASPVLAQDDPTPVRAIDEAGRAAAALNIGYFDRAGLPAAVVAAMQAEVERLLGRLGVAVTTLDATALMSSDNLPSGTLLNIVVWNRLPEAWGLKSHTMGVCPDSGSLPRNVYAFEPAILEELGLANKGFDAMRTEDVGRAFGRVVAHEVIHAFATFAGEDRHRGNGLMGESLDRDTLLRPGIGVDERSGSAFRAGLAKASATL